MQSRAWHARAVQLVDGIVAGILLAAVFLAPLAFGAVHAWARALLELALLAAALAWCARGLLAGPRGRVARAVGVSRPVRIVTATGVFFLALQLVPLPPALVGAVSPETGRTLRLGLAGWPASAGYAEVADPLIGVWRPLALSPPLARAQGVRWLCLAIAFGCAAAFPWRHARRVALRFAWVLLAVAALEASVALYQSETGSDRIFTFRNPHALQWPTGTYVNRNHLADLLAMALPVAIGLAMDAASRLAAAWRKNGPPRSPGARYRRLQRLVSSGGLLRFALCVGLAVWMLLALYRTLSRAGFLAPLAACALLAPLLVRRQGAGERAPRGAVRRGAPAVALGAVFAALFATGLPELAARLSAADASASAAGRAAILRDSLRVVGSFPVAGAGMGNFPITFPAWRTFGGDRVSHAHNDYVEVAAEAGLPVLVAALALLLALLRRSARRLREDCGERHVLWGLTAGLVAFLLHAAVDFPFQIPANALVAVVLAGLIVRLSAPRVQPGQARRPWRVRAALCTAAAVGFAALFVGRAARAAAEVGFHAVFPDSSLLPASGERNLPAPAEAVQQLRVLAADFPEQRFLRYRLGVEVERLWGEGLARGEEDPSLPREALRHLATAARLAPQWAWPHLHLGLLAAAGHDADGRIDPVAELERAERLEPMGRTLRAAAARARARLVAEGRT